jgi:hypothetical protein
MVVILHSRRLSKAWHVLQKLFPLALVQQCSSAEGHRHLLVLLRNA